jgi:hypothetical protein
MPIEDYALAAEALDKIAKSIKDPLRKQKMLKRAAECREIAEMQANLSHRRLQSGSASSDDARGTAE